MLNIYTISDDYIGYLRQFDPRILHNKSAKRKYLGIVKMINNINYFIPMSSPKPKHSHMKNKVDIILMHDVSNHNIALGALNLNMMIPVPLSECIKINSSNYDIKYARLLGLQLRYISHFEQSIINKANRMYNMRYKSNIKKYEQRILEHTLDFKFLETKYSQYILSKSY